MLLFCTHNVGQTASRGSISVDRGKQYRFRDRLILATTTRCPAEDIQIPSRSRCLCPHPISNSFVPIHSILLVLQRPPFTMKFQALALTFLLGMALANPMPEAEPNALAAAKTKTHTRRKHRTRKTTKTTITIPTTPITTPITTPTTPITTPITAPTTPTTTKDPKPTGNPGGCNTEVTVCTSSTIGCPCRLLLVDGTCTSGFLGVAVCSLSCFRGRTPDTDYRFQFCSPL